MAYNPTLFYEQPELSLVFQIADANKEIYVGERSSCCISGVIIDRNSIYNVQLSAYPLFTCSAYVFSYITHDGTEKAIIYHANACGPRYAKWIAEQITHETDLSTVSIIIAMAGGDDNIREDMHLISSKHSEQLIEAGFTNKIQILFGNFNYRINSKGKHGNGPCTNDMTFKSTSSIDQKQGLTCLLF